MMKVCLNGKESIELISEFKNDYCVIIPMFVVEKIVERINLKYASVFSMYSKQTEEYSYDES